MIMPISGGLHECQTKCNIKKECTAIEYSDDVEGAKCCVLRKCPFPVPRPQVVQAKWHNGKHKYVGYVKCKYTGIQFSNSSHYIYIYIYDMYDICAIILYFVRDRERYLK